MTLAPGLKLGPYEIVGQIGAGGMGEVWKARDPKLERFVAIKVLPPDFAADADRLRRFQQEAKALAALSHPNLVQVFEAGEHGGTPFLVMELLEGETLRERLAGRALPPRRAVEVALQVAQGLSAAHAQGILHRDLKPENLFLTKDGRCKILDFGLARVDPGQPIGQESATRAFLSEPGTVVGTSGYMSPEQVQGGALDARSDLFSLGVVLWELVTGRGPFHRDSAVETLHAILKEDPPDLDPGLKVPPGLVRILDHCLAKEPAARFHSATDLAFALEGAATVSSTKGSAALGQAGRGPRRGWLPWLAALGMAAAGLGGWLLRGPEAQPTPVFKAITSRRGNLLSARFSPDGQSIVYSAAWEGRPAEVFLCRRDGTGVRALGLSRASVEGVGPRGEVLVLLKPERWSATGQGWGTLALASVDGGTPKELVEEVHTADLGPDGQSIAAVIHTGEDGKDRLEYPLGTTLMAAGETGVGILRIAPDGSRVAVLLYDKGEMVLALLDRSGQRQDLFRSPTALGGLAWIQGGKALVTFQSAPQGVEGVGVGGTLLAVDLKGRVTRLQAGASPLLLHHASAQGALLLEQYQGRGEAVVRRGGREVDLSLGTGTSIQGLSADGAWALLTDWSAAQGQCYLRRTDGAPPKALGAGSGQALSPDGKWALLIQPGPTARVRLVPTGLGQERDLDAGDPELSPIGGGFFPGGRSTWILYKQGKDRTFLVPFDGEGRRGAPVPLPSRNVVSLSPAGDRVLWLDKERRPFLSPVQGGAAVPLPWSPGAEEWVVAWDRPGEVLVRHAVDAVHERLDRVDLLTGKRTPLGTYAPAEATGVVGLGGLLLSEDRQTVGLSYSRVTHSALLLAEGAVPR